jgi:hypothetical protein
MENEWIEKLAVQDLLARYAHAIDDLDPEAWAQCFTPDGVFQVGSRAMGPGLREYGKVHVQNPLSSHDRELLYEINGNEATGCAMFTPAAALVGINFCSQNVDRLVTGWQWRNAYRRVDIDGRQTSCAELRSRGAAHPTSVRCRT